MSGSYVNPQFANITPPEAGPSTLPPSYPPMATNDPLDLPGPSSSSSKQPLPSSTQPTDDDDYPLSTAAAELSAVKKDTTINDKALENIDKSDAQILSTLSSTTDNDLLPSYSDLVASGQVFDSEANQRINLSYLNVITQLAKLSAELGVKVYNEYKAKGIHFRLQTFVTQGLNMYKLLAVVRLMISELRLSEDTYIYLQGACEYTGVQMLVRYAILKKNPMVFRRDEEGAVAIELLQEKYQKRWLELATLVTNPGFRKLPKDAQAAKIDVPCGQFHMILFKLIDPDYSYHTGKRISRFMDKMFGNSEKTKPCTSGLCWLSPEAQAAVKYRCTCPEGEGKYAKKKAERAAPGYDPGLPPLSQVVESRVL